MKREGYLYEKITSLENIINAIDCAAKGKTDKRETKKVLNNLLVSAEKIQDMLLNKTYIPCDYKQIKIKDGANKKERTIFKPKFFPDQIIHWSLMLQIQPIIMRGMYQYCCGSVPKRGIHYASKYVKKIIKSDKKNTKYCLQLDIKKFYPSVNHDALKEMFAKKIKDQDCLWLINLIIDSAEGLPIGTYTSQWFSNFYLQELDHYIKEKLQAKYYIRYVDDIVILGNNKKRLHYIRTKIIEYLKTIKLKIKSNWQVYVVSKRPIDFLGFKFYRNKTILRGRNFLRIRRRFVKINKKPRLNIIDARAIISYWGWIKYSDSYMWYNKNKGKYTIKQAKKEVSRYEKAKNIRENT